MYLVGAYGVPEVVFVYRYLVIALRKPTFQSAIIEPHRAFLETLRSQGRLELAGPFTDQSGGAYILKAANREEAQALAFTDPIHTSDSSVVTVYEWRAQP
ncbi:MAG: YciI family protein [Acidiferrobacter sp.]